MVSPPDVLTPPAETLTPTPAVEEIPSLAGLPPRRLLELSLQAAPALRGGWLLTGLLAVLAGAGRIVAPLTVQHAIDAGVTPSAVTSAVTVAAVALVVAGASSVLLNRRVQRRIESSLAELRRAGLQRVHEMAAATADRVPSADLVTRLTSDVDQVTTFLQGGGIQFLTNISQLLLATVIMFVYCWQLAVPVVLLSALLMLAMVLIQRVIARRYDRARRDLSRLQSAIAETVSGLPVIRTHGIRSLTRARVSGAIDRARDSLISTLVPLNANTSLGELAISTMTVTVLLGGVEFARAGNPIEPRLSAGQVVAMIFLVTFFVRPLQFLVQSLGEAQNALTGWRRTVELVTVPTADASHPSTLPAGSLGIRLEHVSAGYGAGLLVLRDVDVDIRPGEHVAVVGRTGSGKSTFAKLLTRRVEPVAGTVCLGGVPIDRVRAEELARRVLVVPQDPFLFNATIRHNVMLAAPRGSAVELADTIRQLGLEAWVATLPDGLDTQVGQRGERLSVGERQLVAIIRTTLADPDVVVLDEATSGVDPATDVAVHSALAALSSRRTTISIAHRLNTAESADRVLVFADGRIVQSGPHGRLLDEPGPYTDLVRAWNRRHSQAVGSAPVLAGPAPTRGSL